MSQLWEFSLPWVGKLKRNINQDQEKYYNLGLPSLHIGLLFVPKQTVSVCSSQNIHRPASDCLPHGSRPPHESTRQSRHDSDYAATWNHTPCATARVTRDRRLLKAAQTTWLRDPRAVALRPIYVQLPCCRDYIVHMAHHLGSLNTLISLEIILRIWSIWPHWGTSLVFCPGWTVSPTFSRLGTSVRITCSLQSL